jgi:hypothetical protein
MSLQGVYWRSPPTTTCMPPHNRPAAAGDENRDARKMDRLPCGHRRGTPEREKGYRWVVNVEEKRIPGFNFWLVIQCFWICLSPISHLPQMHSFVWRTCTRWLLAKLGCIIFHIFALLLTLHQYFTSIASPNIWRLLVACICTDGARKV